MKKYLMILLILVAFIIIPNYINAETITLTQEDFDAAKSSAIFHPGHCSEGEYDQSECEENGNYWEEDCYSPGEPVNGVSYASDMDGTSYFIESGTYRLGSNVNLDSIWGILISEDDQVMINLNGKTITGEGAIFDIVGSGNLTINGNGEVIGNWNYNFGSTYDKITIYQYGGDSHLTINGGTYRGVLFSDQANLTINGGSFYSNAYAAIAVKSINNLKITDGYFSGPFAGLGSINGNEISISGGEFDGGLAGTALVINSGLPNVKLSGGTYRASNNGYGGFVFSSSLLNETVFKTLANNALASGFVYDNELEYYQTTDDYFGTVAYSQKEISVVRSSEVTELVQADFDEAKQNGQSDKGIIYYGNRYELNGGNYKLGSSINIDKQININNDADVLLDINGKTIESEEHVFVTGGTLTINGNGKILCNDDSAIYSYGTLTINGDVEVIGGNINYNGLLSTIAGSKLAVETSSTLTINAGTYRGSILVWDGSTIVINDGKFYNDAVALAVIHDVDPINSLTINGGYFEGDAAGIALLGNIDTFKITGGTFKGGGAGLLLFANSQIDTIELSGGKYIAEGEESLGGMVNILGDYEISEEIYKNIANSILKSGYMYYEPIEYNHTTISNYGFVAYTQKEISVIPTTAEYEIIEGDNQTYKKGDLVIKSNGDFDLFVGLLLDEEEIDESNYTAVSGSTIVTLKGDYLNTIPNGEHTVTFVYANGQVSATFNKTISNMPETLDNIYSYILLLIASFVMIIIGRKLIKNN